MLDKLCLFLFSNKTYVLDICWNRLIEAILTNTQNMFLKY